MSNETEMGNLFNYDPSSFDSKRMAELVEQIEREGYVELENIIPGSLLASATEYCSKIREVARADYITLRGTEMDNCVLKNIQESPQLVLFLKKLLRASGLPCNNEEIVHHVLRSITGDSDGSAANKYHFDAYHLTVNIPIEIPVSSDRNTGDFVFFRRRRSHSSGLTKNFLYKAFFQSSFVRRIASSKAFYWWFDGKVLITKPGSMYVFYGYATYHGNLSLASELTRTTALYHYSDPFHNNKLIKMIEDRRVSPQNRN